MSDATVPEQANPETAAIVVEVIKTLEAKASNQMMGDILEERKAERRWTFMRRAILAVAVLSAMIAWLTFMAGWWGYRVIPTGDSVAVVPITGTIQRDSQASATAVITVLDKLFETDRIKGIVLEIDSGGGSPTEAERIGEYLTRQKQRTGKPVVAVCQSMCASAAYMIAIRADEVVVGKYSWSGSIGAILKGWDLQKVADRFEVGQRVFASGSLKDLMNPFQELPTPMAERMEVLVNQAAATFIEDVKRARGSKLDLAANPFTGNIWTGEDALRIGLVDGIGTIETVVEERFDGMNHAYYTPKMKENSFFGALFSDMGRAIAIELKNKYEPRLEM